VTFYLLLTGFLSILGQVVILRELNVAFYGIELIYLLAIGIWLLGTGVGAILSRRGALPSRFALSWLVIIFAALLPLDVVAVRAVRVIFGAVPGAYLSFPQQVLGICLVVLPTGLLLGLMFGWTAKLFVAAGRTVAAAYAIESAGGVTGGVVSTALLKIGLQNWTAALICALAAALTVAFSKHNNVATHRRMPQFAGLILGLALILAVGSSGTVDQHMTAWNHPHLAASQDSPYGRVTVDMLLGQISVFENDALSFESQGTAAEEFAHLTALSHPDPQNILLLGGGIDGTLRELMKHRPRNVEYIELNPILLKLTKAFLPDDDRRLLNDIRVKIRITDPRKYLLKKAEKYDLILVAMPEPSSGQASRFFTHEFFQLCAEHLLPGGRLAFKIRSAENFWTAQLARRAASIYLALKSAFLDVLVLPGTSDIFIAANPTAGDSLESDPEIYIQRWHDRDIQASLVTPDYIRYRLTNDRVQKAARVLETESVPVNSDSHPICFHYALLIWLSKFFPALFRPEFSSLEALAKSHPWMAVAGVLVGLSIVAVVRHWLLSRRIALAGIAGFAGMVLETLLILHYQVKNGVLYQDIGLLLTLFMLGLAIGAGAADRLFVGRQLRSTATHGEMYVKDVTAEGFKKEKSQLLRAYGTAAVPAFAAVSLLTALLTGMNLAGGIFWTGMLLVAAGFMVAVIFAYSTLVGQPEPQRVIGPLYCADLVGGAAAALLSTLVLIPLAGLTTTALMAALLSLPMALLI
jgi:spermidine synthase